MKTKLTNHVTIILVFSLLQACNDADFLEEKRDSNQVIPQTLEDYRALMYNSQRINQESALLLAQVGTDEYSISDVRWNNMSQVYEKNGSIWASDIFEGTESLDWNFGYRKVLYCNVVLEGISRLESQGAESSQAAGELKGTALFHRALAFYELAQLFCDTYTEASAESTAGIPLRLESDINMVSSRASVRQTYEQITADLSLAESYLPVSQAIKEHPTKRAALALLARVYLQMGKFEQALAAAERVLQQGDDPLDFSNLEISPNFMFDYRGANNPDVIFYNAHGQLSIESPSNTSVNPERYAEYEDGDLRKQAFFLLREDGSIEYRGSYTGGVRSFTGLTIGETLLIAAEASSRTGQFSRTRSYLSVLLEARYIPQAMPQLDTLSEEDLLLCITQQRKKELFKRGIYWSDLKRLNRDGTWRITLRRVIGSLEYTIPPNDPRYVYPIPEQVIRISGIAQNNRE
ncbi:RagB/SusD family nutrient uptake outer membrane protein [Sphingobacterium paludis]|uniref:SusD-like starch-binding protein associating with outer membrane n=1 Tax=Sphingobacterium paludis TaxID=1476465 RepID=A0A4R7CSQ6_9SPHI|nr:RagB/SusD family nutrient uptake outer membrane protein [Sphingobacterium paludis]TDS06813.1 SusD-like starch-binding protein associating with outer membrane [Sphingobacterium paludis]